VALYQLSIIMVILISLRLILMILKEYMLLAWHTTLCKRSLSV